ncbi:MAG TPA: hypothetical protein VGI42_04140, partial [Chthoniobacterales bacterium]
MFPGRLVVFSLLALSIFQTASGQSNPTPAPVFTATPAPITFSSVHVDGPYIALTFDDGPHPT